MEEAITFDFENLTYDDILDKPSHDETCYFEDLDEPIQEIILDLLASIIKNS